MSSKTRTRETRTTPGSGSTPILRSVPDHTTVVKVRTDAEDKLWAALHAAPNSTATDLAEAAEIGRSTAQKLLVKWASDGSLTRTVGIAKGGRRAADLWAITEADTDPTDADHQIPTGDVDVEDAAQPDPPAPIEQNTSGTCDAAPIDDDPAEPTNPTPTDTAARTPATTGTEMTEPVDERVATDPGTEAERGGYVKAARLASGSLRGMVEDYLRDHPGEEFGPTAIAKALGGKSSGAVSNALDKLTGDGTAVKTKESPRRFTLATAEQTSSHTATS
ncbi:hypothetical protein [Saccharothrix sp. NRRL B-16348]|uniref:hypothetical protein n=1 Tax=Saccharothrix sp. NRRL B-16348 TaxID=1415542 RepID=UPI0006AF7C13|nr:hypothetical protein [Saccharothrix sp. NRRL B-16348]